MEWSQIAQRLASIPLNIHLNIPSKWNRQAFAGESGAGDPDGCFDDLSPRPETLRTGERSKMSSCIVNINKTHSCSASTVSFRRPHRAAALLLVAMLTVPPPTGLAQEPEPATNSVKIDSEGDTPIVVTATRVAMPVDQVGSSISVISAEEIEAKQAHSLLEILKSVPGIDVVRNGGPGGNTSIFLRGANSEHTLVLIDGVEVNNPISTSRAYNFADITLDNIEQIEVLRGPQSTIYGSDALGGVINIITKKGSGKPTGFVSFEAGSYETAIEKAGSSGAIGAADYAVAFSREDSSSISAASAADGNSEPDGFHNTSGSGRFGYKTEIARIDVSGRLHNANADIDNSGGSGQDDPNRHLNTNQHSVRAAVSTSAIVPKLEHTASISFAETSHEDNNDPDPTHPLDRLRSEFTGALFKLDLMNTYQIDDNQRIVFGLETEKERGDSDYASDGEFGPFATTFAKKEARSNGYYAQAILGGSADFSSSFGIRLDDHDRFGSEVTWRIAPTYLIRSTDTRFKASVGTGFKAPSLYQLYSEYGREDLDAEESLGFDIGVEQSVASKALTIGVTLFRNEFDKLISFDPNTFIFENIADANTQGVEVTANAPLTEELTLRSGYTFTETEDESSGEALLRRAKHRANLDVDYSFIPEAHAHVGVLYIGKRDDNDFTNFPATRVELSDHTVVYLAGSYELSESLSLFARIDNLFDKEYEEVLGYGTPGASAFGGIKLSF